jgi:hypothetical protein
MKQPCVCAGVCEDMNCGNCNPDNCYYYTPDLLPMLKRWRTVCLERANRLKNKSEISKAAILLGKCEAIRKIIAHMERKK